MANKQFLEEYPLYRKFVSSFNQWTTLNELPKPAIHMYCDRCESDQTFNMANEYYEVDYASDIYVPRTTVRALYTCSGCAAFQRRFLIRFILAKVTERNDAGEDVAREIIYMEKVGQYPSWSIVMDKELENLLGDHAEFYKRGLISESQGYGIGAFAYYRRIVEEIIDQLLISIEELISAEDKQKYATALAAVKKTTVTQEKIELVKDLLPASLRPNGINPLDALHSALSAGLHAESEEDCLEYAEAVRDALVFLVNRLVRTKSENKSFTDSMKKLLDKKNGKGQKKQS